MRLGLQFTQGTPPFSYSSSKTGVPYELQVEDVGSNLSQSQSLTKVVRALGYIFKGVSNYATGEISHVTVEKGVLGRVTKSFDTVKWDSKIDKTFVVIYGVDSQGIFEDMYVADAIATMKDAAGNRQVEPLWLVPLLHPEQAHRKEMLISAVTLATKYGRGYSLVFSPEKGGSLLIRNKKGAYIELDAITDTEVFVLFRLLLLLVRKGQHMGVFMVNARGFSDDILHSFSDIARIFFLETYIFFYNTPKNCTVEREVITLPNFTAEK